jgi:hypothetical protein
MKPAILSMLLLAACSGKDGDDTAGKAPGEPAKIVDPKSRERRPEPDYVTVDHILIGVRGEKMPDGLTPAEANKLVDKILDELRAGASWYDLKQQYSKDPGQGGVRGGPYEMANAGKPARNGATPRGNMVNAFGDVGFQLELDEIAVSGFQVKRGPGWSPFGYHIIKRVK